MNLHIFKKNRIRIIATFLSVFFILVVAGLPVMAAMPAFNGDEAVYAVDTKTGDVIVQQNAHQKMYPASTTKTMTALVAMHYVKNKMNQKVKVGNEVNEINGDSSKADIRKGDVLTWRQLLYALLLPSGNDAAMTIATNIGRMDAKNSKLSTDKAIARFVALMNEESKTLKLEDSHFVNPHGYHDDNHYTTAADLVKIGIHLMKYKEIDQIVKTKVYTCHLKSGDKKWINTNALLISPADLPQVTGSSYDGKEYNPYVTGVKTGHTDKAGHCLVFSSKYKDKTMIAVIMHGDNNLWNQANGVVNTFDIDFQKVNWTKKDGSFKTIRLTHVRIANSKQLTLTANKQISSYIDKNQKKAYTTQLQLNSAKFEKKGQSYKLIQTVKKQQKVGNFVVKKNGQIIKRVPLYASKTVHRRRFFDYFLIFLIILIPCGLIFRYYQVQAIRRRRKRRRRRK
jgi:D-alanyl-D-alanine carboxypeptidase (penicillin-binding protein 5/6)